MRAYLLSALVVLLFVHAAKSQTIRGIVIDSLTKQPIAFASIVLDDNRTGTSSDIEGKFSISIPSNYSGLLTISHISYEKKRVSTNYFKNSSSIVLTPNTTILGEVSVTAAKEENPAFRIIRQAIAHKKDHDPDQLQSYEYISYNKFLVTLSQPTKPLDSILKKIKSKDTVKLAKNKKNIIKFDSLSKTTHFFLSESVTEKQKINPDKEKEKLLALQVSGFKSPIFTNVATDYQPFSFYKDNIPLLTREYVNPIAKGTFHRYDFFLKDTTYYDKDTVYIIQYQPKPGKFFNGLKGMISICTDGFAIKNVIASSADSLALTSIRIQQNYERVNGQWFPVQLNTDIDFHSQKIFDRYVIVQHRSFLKEIKINPSLKSSSFGDVKVELALPKADENKLLLNRFRNDSLDFKEKRTYTLLDSATRKLRFLDKFIEALVVQTVPLGIFEMDLTRISRINKYESYRLGTGIYTSNKFSKWFRTGGYAGYGFRDEQWKYGGEIKFTFNQNKDLFLKFTYSKDIYETGSSHIIREGQLPSSESFRQFIAFQFDKIESYKGEFGYRIFPDVHASIFTSQNKIQPTYNYRLLFKGDTINTFSITELGLNVRYVHSESYMTLHGKKVFLGQRFPVFTFSFVQAAPMFNAQNFNYVKFDFSAKQLFTHRNGSKTRFFLAAGLVNGIAPYGKLYNGRGSSISSYLVDDYFQTMGIYEFTASAYASIFLHHNFGNILLNKKYSKPELVLYHNMGIGKLENQNAHLGLTLQSFDKGYLESGIGLNNLIRGKYANVAHWGFGGGVFYRYGPYQLQQTENNVAAKIIFGLTF